MKPQAPPQRHASGTIFVPYAELRAHGIPFTRVHLNRLIAKGDFPPPHELSSNRIAWTRDSLEVWKASRPIHRSPKVPEARKAAHDHDHDQSS